MSKNIIYRLPKSEDDDVLRLQSRPSRLIRLQSLQLYPRQFSSRYEDEIEYKEELWLSRLRPAHVQHFVIMTVDNEDERKQDLVLDDKTEFHGMMVVINEYEAEQTDRASSDNAVAVRESSAVPVYFLGCLYVDNSFQSQGWGTKLIKTSIEWIKEDARSKYWSSIKYRTAAVDDNRAISLYLRMGFKVDGVEVYHDGRNITQLSMIIDIGQD